MPHESTEEECDESENSDAEADQLSMLSSTNLKLMYLLRGVEADISSGKIEESTLALHSAKIRDFLQNADPQECLHCTVDSSEITLEYILDAEKQQCLRTLEREIDEKEKQAAKVTEAIASLKAEQDCREEFLQLKARLLESKAEESAVEAKLRTAKEKLEEVQHMIHTHEEEKRTLQTESARLLEEKNELDKEQQYAEIKLDRTRQDAAKAVSSCAEASKRLTALQVAVEDMSMKHQHLKDAVKFELKNKADQQRQHLLEQWAGRKHGHNFADSAQAVTESAPAHEQSETTVDSLAISIGVLHETIEEALTRIIRIFMLSNIDDISNSSSIEALGREVEAVAS